MSKHSGVKPLPILAVLGAGDASAEEISVAERVGAIAARAGWVVLTGGGSGVMEAACRGAVEAGGLTIGILPGRGPDESPPNAHIDLPIFTGLSYARNVINVLSSHAIIAVAGGSGTLSEIALALKYCKPVILLESWHFEIDGFQPPATLYRAPDLAAALAHLAELCPPPRGPAGRAG